MLDEKRMCYTDAMIRHAFFKKYVLPYLLALLDVLVFACLFGIISVAFKRQASLGFQTGYLPLVPVYPLFILRQSKLIPIPFPVLLLGALIISPPFSWLIETYLPEMVQLSWQFIVVSFLALLVIEKLTFKFRRNYPVWSNPALVAEE
jgi:hypothetical protein